MLKRTPHRATRLVIAALSGLLFETPLVALMIVPSAAPPLADGPEPARVAVLERYQDTAAAGSRVQVDSRGTPADSGGVQPSARAAPIEVEDPLGGLSPADTALALAWSRRVKDFAASVRNGTTRSVGGVQLLDSLRVQIEETRSGLRAALRDRDMERAAPFDYALLDLFGARDSLLAVLPESERDRLFAMGRAGLVAVRSELQFFWLHSRFETLAVRDTIEAVFVHLINSPLLWMRQFLTIALAVGIFIWWRRWIAGALVRWRRQLIEIRPIRRQNVRLAKALWYLERIRSPLEWLALIAAVVTVTAAQDFGPALFVWAVAKWVLIGWTAVLLVDAFAARSPAARRDHRGLRRRSLWALCWWIVAYGLGRELVGDFFGRAALFHWITAVLLVVLALLTVTLIVWWRDEVPERLDDLTVRPRFIDALLTRREGLQRYVISLAGGLYLTYDGIRRSIVRVLAQSELGRRSLAHLTRSEIARQALDADTTIQGDPIPDELRERLLNGSGPVIERVARDTVAQLVDVLDRHIGTVAGLVGERGAGKSCTIQRLIDRTDRHVVSVQCPFGDRHDLVAALAGAAELSPDADAGAIGAALRDSQTEVVVLDDVHRLARPVIGGREDLDSLRDILRAAGPTVSWVLTLDAMAWEYIRQFQEDEPLHHHLLRLEPWSEDEIGRLISSRNRAVDIEPDFSRLNLPRQLDDGSYDNLESRNRATFFRILWDDADGNPEAALRLWADSLVRAEAGKLVVRLPHPPTATELEGVPSTLFFILRTLLRLERATTEQIAECLPVGMAQVEDSLSFARSKGIVEDVGGTMSVSWRWDRAVRRALARRNMTA